MLEHINIEFDLNSGIVTAETMARDHHGRPKYEYVYDSNTENTVEIVKPDYVEDAVPVLLLCPFGLLQSLQFIFDLTVATPNNLRAQITA